jgi:hypothetical protein
VSGRGGTTTPGPEAYFALTLTEATTIDVAVASEVAPLIAIRPGACKESISELACNDGAPPPAFDPDTYFGDGGSDQLSRWSVLRTPLEAGIYTIVVDTLALGELKSADFVLSLRGVQPRANASCAAPILLTSGALVKSEPLDLGSTRRPVCGAAPQSSLFYTVGVGPGQRLTARAAPAGGQFAWMPRIEAFSTCSASSCLAQGRLASGTAQQLDWINNGAAWQLVYLAVGADSPMQGVSFDLGVTVADAVATCSRPVPVMDGTTMLGQDFAFAAQNGQTCFGSSKALYYTATLLPKQTLTVHALPSGNSGGNSPNVSVRPSCDVTACGTVGNGASVTNTSNDDQTMIIEIVPAQFTPSSTFDLSIEMPPPPAAIVVTPTTDLVTSESGKTATFSIVLASPPSADVTIAIASDTPPEGTASPASVRFTSTNWRTPQTITVTGVDDQASDGPRDYTIVTSPAVSKDGRYSGLDADDVGATNLDDDPGVSFSRLSGVLTTEGGGTDTFTATLNAVPTAPVTLTLTSSDVSEASVSPTQLTFTSANWNQPQIVTVKGVDDAVPDGAQAYQILSARLASDDARYANLDPPDVAGINIDDDQIAVPLKVLSGQHNCLASQSKVPIAVDQGGQIYIVMMCEGQLLLTTSEDGGVTFTEPTAIPGIDSLEGAVDLAAGAPGLAYLLFTGDGGMLQLVRTTDGGATWSTPTVISNVTDVAHVSASGRTAFVVAHPPTDGNKVALWRSTNGGRSFSMNLLPETTIIDATLAPDGQTGWLFQQDGNATLGKSTDAGSTFSSVAQLNTDPSWHAVGRTHLYTLSGEVEIFDLTDLTASPTSVAYSSGSSPFMMTVDAADTLTFLDLDAQSRLRATHVVPGASVSLVQSTVGPTPNGAGIASLSPKASAVAIVNGTLVLYTTVIW